MKSRDKGDSVFSAQNIIRSVEQVPVGVVDEDEDTRLHRIFWLDQILHVGQQLDKHIKMLPIFNFKHQSLTFSLLIFLNTSLTVLSSPPSVSGKNFCPFAWVSAPPQNSSVTSMCATSSLSESDTIVRYKRHGMCDDLHKFFLRERRKSRFRF